MTTSPPPRFEGLFNHPLMFAGMPSTSALDRHRTTPRSHLAGRQKPGGLYLLEALYWTLAPGKGAGHSCRMAQIER